MSKTKRRIIFYIAALVFFAASYVVILYAQGYKYSFSDDRFFRTGAISLKINENAKVFLNDKLQGQTSFFDSGLGIDGLLPGRYVVRLQRDGYSSWQKTVTVQEGSVADFPKVMILPTDEENGIKIEKEIETLLAPTPAPKPAAGPFVLVGKTLYHVRDNERTVVDTNVSGFVLSPSEKKLAWWNASELWVLWLDDTNYQPFKKADERELITRFSTPIRKAAWLRGDDSIALDSSGYKIVEIDTRGGINIIKI